MPFPAMPTSVRCPQCGANFVVQLRTIVDVGEEPELKEQFLRGRLNYARCPKCGGGGQLRAPLVYHDPDRELLITYVPSEMGMSADEQEKYVGSLVNSVMNSLPQEKRKGYFFQPKTALTMESVYDTVLEADGVSRKVIEEQRKQVRLIGQLLEALDDDEALDRIVDEHRDELDYEFFLLLSNMMDADRELDEMSESEREELAQDRARLTTLRDKLLERVSPRMPGAAPQDATYDDLINMLRDTQGDDAWRRAVAANRGRLDYGFFQTLTSKIEQARSGGNSEEAEALTDLRRRINEELDRQDEMVRAAEDQAGLLIMELLEQDDLHNAVREHRDEIDEVFIALLGRYLAAAQRRSDEKRAQRLKALMDATLAMLEEELPPEVRLINRLARAKHPDETNDLLEEHRGLLTDEFVKRFDQVVASTAERDEELHKHLQAVRGQIVAKMTIQRS